MTDRTPDELASVLDLTLLRPEAGMREHTALAAAAVRAGVYGVCVAPAWVSTARGLLDAAGPAGARIVVVSVVAFPTGATSTAAKAFEAARAVLDGAAEIDMVLNLPRALAGDLDHVAAEVAAVREAARAAHPAAAVKVIVESALYGTDPAGLAALDAAARACVAGGADWVKTSTGTHPAGGANLDAVRALAAATAGTPARVKASGGIGDPAFAAQLLAAGAARLGVGADRLAGLLAPAPTPGTGPAAGAADGY